MTYDIIEILAILLLGVACVFTSKAAIDSSAEAAKYKGAYYRCQEAVDSGEKIMTRKQRWQWKARIEALNKIGEKE